MVATGETTKATQSPVTAAESYLTNSGYPFDVFGKTVKAINEVGAVVLL